MALPFQTEEQRGHDPEMIHEADERTGVGRILIPLLANDSYHHLRARWVSLTAAETTHFVR